MLWRKAARKLHAKGYSMTRIADVLEEEFGTGLGLGRSSLGVLVTTEKEEVPPDKLSFLEALPVLNEKKYKNYLSETADEPADEESAAPVTPRLDALVSMVGAKLDALLTALSAELGTVAASLLGKLDACTMPADAKLDSIGGKLVSAHQKLDRLQATVNDTDAKLDRAEFKRDEDKRELLNAVRGTRRVVTGAAVGCLVLLLGGMALLSGRSQGATQPIIIVTSVAQGSTPLVFDTRALLGAIAAMGKKAEENWIPKERLPNLKLAKDCRPGLGETPINGGCWVRIADVKPPCVELFRQGDSCYRPVAADPNVPVGVIPQAPGQEAH